MRLSIPINKLSYPDVRRKFQLLLSYPDVRRKFQLLLSYLMCGESHFYI